MLRDSKAFDACDKAYAKVGFVQHTGRTVRGATHASGLGSDIDGVAGLVAALVLGTTAIVWLTFKQLVICITTYGILDSSVARFVQRFLYRRPVLCV